MPSTRQNVLLEGTILVLAIVTLALAAKYAIQLQHAPTGGSDLNPSKAAMMATYLIPPAITILLSSVHMIMYATHVAGAVYALVMTTLLAVGWLVTATIWGQCHGEAHNNPDNPWYGVCYQTSVEMDFGTEYMQGVSKPLGGAVVAFAALIVVLYTAYTAAAAVGLHHARKTASQY